MTRKYKPVRNCAAFCSLELLGALLSGSVVLASCVKHDSGADTSLAALEQDAGSDTLAAADADQPQTDAVDAAADAGQPLADAVDASSDEHAPSADSARSSDRPSSDMVGDESTQDEGSTEADNSTDGDSLGHVSQFPAPEGPDYAFARGGTRLSAVHLTADNVEQFLHFYDRELETECAFEKLAGRNEYACAPTVPIEVHYLDAACTQPILLASQGSVASPHPASPSEQLLMVSEDFVGSWVTSRGAVECSIENLVPSSTHDLRAPGSDLPLLGEIAGVYEVGEPFALTPDEGSSLTTVHELVDGSCQAISAMVRVRTPADTAYVLVPHRPEELVAAEVHTFDAGEKLDLRRLVGSDGSWQNFGLRNKAGDECELLDDGRCVPGPIESLRATQAFASSSCEGDLVDVYVIERPPCGGHYGALYGDSGTMVYDLIDPGNAGYYLRQDSADPNTGEILVGECLSFTPALLGAGLSAQSFPQAVFALPGTGLLRARRPVAHSGDRIVALDRAVEFVLEDERTCDVALFDDGVYRCAPATPGVIGDVTYYPENQITTAGLGVYADDECTRELFAGPQAQNTLREAPVWNLTTSFHELEPFDGVVYVEEGGVCSPAPGTEFSSVVFVESAELPVAVPVLEKVEL